MITVSTYKNILDDKFQTVSYFIDLKNDFMHSDTYLMYDAGFKLDTSRLEEFTTIKFTGSNIFEKIKTF